MGLITPTSSNGEFVGASELLDTRLRRFRFASIATGDTFPSNIHGVVAYAVGPAISATGLAGGLKTLRANYDDSSNTGEFTFTVTAGPATDIDLFVWSTDY